ncbi:MAG: response regulator transcription factor [Chloroflexi bacterium]|nr:response regulator transcription factor [Chloroflexota bacterium]
MYSVFLLTNESNGTSSLFDRIGRAGLSCQTGCDLSTVEEGSASPAPEAVLLDLASVDRTQAHQFVDQCRKLRMPVVAVVPREQVADHDPLLNADEFIFAPVREEELVARIKQAIFRVNGPSGSKILRVGELTVDLERYDVTVAGRRVSLTYKEFQLLVLLASNPGRVYTREALLSQVWGYDYLGGTRTVDVHVRRLRSKVEGPGRSFVETIWNVGYRFKTP